MLAEGGFTGSGVVYLVLNDPYTAETAINKVFSAVEHLRKWYGVDVKVDSLHGEPPMHSPLPHEDSGLPTDDGNYMVVNGKIVSLDGPLELIYKALENELVTLILAPTTPEQANAGAPQSLGRGPPGGVDAEYLVAA